VRWDEYVASGIPFAKLNRAELQAARVILGALEDGYRALRTSQETFTAAMEYEIDWLLSEWNLKLSAAQFKDLRAEFLVYRSNFRDSRDSVAYERKTLLERYQQECSDAGTPKPSQEDIARECGWKERTIIGW